MGNKISKNSHYIATTLLTLIAFFGLAAPLVSTGAFRENGFNMISFASNVINDSYRALLYITGVFSILQLLACVTAILFFIITLSLPEKKNDKKLSFIFNIIYLCLMFVYMILGITYAAIASSKVDGAFYTLSYIPFMLGTLVFVFYYLQQKLEGNFQKPEKTEKAEKPVKVKKGKIEEAKEEE